MTVSASLDGRILISKGYGYSDVDAEIQMQPYSRSFIGSVSKVITTLGMMKVLEQRSDLDVNSKIYSEVLDDPSFIEAYRRGIRRNIPVVATAMDNRGRVYTWYTNKEYSIGTPEDLDAYQNLQPFELPEDKTVYDVVGMAIIGTYLHTFYKNRTYSVGTAYNLASIKAPSVNAEVVTPKISSGSGTYGMRRIVGMAGLNTADVLTIYDDGTMSSGSPNDLGRKLHTTLPMNETRAFSRYDIRGIAGSKENGTLFIWFSNEKVTSGSLLQHNGIIGSPRDYELPWGVQSSLVSEDTRMAVWYNNLAVKHLLSHTSGYSWTYEKTGASEKKYGTEAMFNFSQSPWTADQVGLQNKYFLSTQFLSNVPGSRRAYDNNNFGFLEYVIYRLSKMEYGNFMDEYLFKPNGLSGKFSNYRGIRIQDDATPYNRDSGELIALMDQEENKDEIYDPLRNLSNVSSAGGWASNAESLILLLLSVDGLNSHPDVLNQESIQSMENVELIQAYYNSEGEAYRDPPFRYFPLGWGRDFLDRGIRYKHNGIPFTGGGYSWIAKYSADAVNGNLDLSNIQIAVCKNTNGGTGFDTLRSEIAKVIARHRNIISPNYDLYNRLVNRKIDLSGIVLFRPSSTEWRFDYNLDGKTDFILPTWGRSTDMPLIGDFNGTGLDGIALFRPEERKWFIRYNFSGSEGKRTIENYGNPGDIPITGDFNNDGKCDIGFFRPKPASGEWHLNFNLDNHSDQVFSWGRSSDIPLTGDFNGNGTVGIALFRPAEGKWFIRFNISGSEGKRTIENYGKPGDIPIAGDFNQDGKCDIGFFRPSSGQWHLNYNLDNHSDRVISWGKSTDIPIGM
ncbi:MAG: serine hydrolase [Lewinella sp.]|nr:serine hydrolase [Lewinella sp.]